MTKIADKLKRLRCRAKLTQEQTACKAGLDARTIRRIESGNYDPLASNLNKVANVFGYEVEQRLKKLELCEINKGG